MVTDIIRRFFPVVVLLLIAVVGGVLIGAWRLQGTKDETVTYSRNAPAPLSVPTSEVLVEVKGTRVFCTANEGTTQDGFWVLVANYGNKAADCELVLSPYLGDKCRPAEPKWLVFDRKVLVEPGVVARCWVGVQPPTFGEPQTMKSGRYSIALQIVRGEQVFTCPVIFEVSGRR